MIPHYYSFDVKQFLHDNAKALVHVQPWFIPGNDHQKQSGITYDSRDPVTIARQVTQIRAMGIDGINVNWYGPANVDLDKATHGLLVECAKQGLMFSLCPDEGIFRGKSNPQQVLNDAMNYAKKTYTTSPAYWRVNGKEVVNFFLYKDGLDWNQIRGILPNAAFLFENKSGYDHPQSNGAYAWVQPQKDPNDIALNYLKDFYSRSVPGKLTVGGAWAGFDDHKASWSPLHSGGAARIMNRNNGCTLLQTLGAVPASVEHVLISTFNDHQEGSAIEYGVAQYN